MRYILQVDFPHDGVFNKEFSDAFRDLAEDIKKEPGLVWKIWTENENTKQGGGIYLFSNENDTKRYLAKHTKRPEESGYSSIRTKIFKVNEPLSLIDNAPLGYENE